MSGAQEEIGVVGGGIVGLSIALKLALEGRRVTLFEADPDGAPASDGNAGHIGTASLVPWANPGNRRSALRFLRDRAHPLRFRVADMLRHPRWIARFLAASTALRAAAGADRLKPLLDRALPAAAPLLKAAGAEDLLRRDGMLHVFESRAAYTAAVPGYEMRAARGIALRHLSTEEIGALEPALRPAAARTLVAGVLLEDVGQIASPRRLRLAYRRAFESLGGRSVTARVTGVSGGIRLETGERRAFGRVILAAGAASPALARGLGVRVPVIAERGYHLQFETQGDLLRRSVLNVDRRVVFSPHEAGLRLTTGAEFTARGRRPDPDWMQPLFEAARALSPEIPPLDKAARWSGDRPSTPDSLPILGPAPGNPSVLLAYGHGHIGLTLAATTATLVADLVAGRRSDIDLAPYAPDRRI
ncbi:MAG: FAD-binding oxidoreductase [Marinovum algicola]|uniref:NAD(P)/FAD-dependent oxidoreductase n=1 Tax=Roseobacteraceae TaxID=2854170 RepID=UPI0032ECA6A9